MIKSVPLRKPGPSVLVVPPACQDPTSTHSLPHPEAHAFSMDGKKNQKTAACEHQARVVAHTIHRKALLGNTACAQLPAKGPALSLCQEISHSANRQSSGHRRQRSRREPSNWRDMLALFSSYTTTNSRGVGVGVGSEEPERCCKF